MFKSIWDAPSASDYFNALWDTSDMADAWADYGDHAEDVWSDDDWDYMAEDAAMEGHLFGWDA